jgi:glycosyltransferase involved in cell wall biosynthesis
VGQQKLKICHVCNAHSVDDGRVFHRACAGLAKEGFEVHLFAVGNGGEKYSAKHVTVHPLPRCESRRLRFSRRFHVAKMAAELSPDLIHVHEPELLGPVISRAGSRPIIYDVHESYLDVLKEREWIPKWIRPFARASWDLWESRLVRRCAGVIVVTERIAQRYRRLHSRVEVVSNYPDISEIDHMPEVVKKPMSCVFAGGISPDRGLSQVVEALAILRKRNLRVTLTLAGPGGSNDYLLSLYCLAEKLGVKDQLEYHGVLTQKEAMVLQRSCSIGLVPYLPVANSMASMANKLLECMALGLPVVFSNFPNYYEVAVPVDPTKPEEIANAMEQLLANPEGASKMGRAGMQATREKFNWEVERRKLVHLYQEILLAPGSNSQSP